MKGYKTPIDDFRLPEENKVFNKDGSREFTFNCEWLSYYIKNKNEFRAIAVYVKSKFLKHSIIYNYTNERAAKVLGITEYLANKYIPILINLGLCKISGKNLLFVAINKLTNPSTGYKIIRNEKVILNKKDSIYEIELKLQGLFLKHKKAQQDFIVNYRSGNLNGSKEAEKIKRSYSGKINNITIQNCRNVSKNLGISLGQSFNVISRLKAKNLIEVKPIIEQLTKSKFSDMKTNGNFIGYLYNYGNLYYNYIGSNITYNNTIYII